VHDFDLGYLIPVPVNKGRDIPVHFSIQMEIFQRSFPESLETAVEIVEIKPGNEADNPVKNP
jgi:hypothetical protein